MTPSQLQIVRRTLNTMAPTTLAAWVMDLEGLGTGLEHDWYTFLRLARAQLDAIVGPDDARKYIKAAADRQSGMTPADDAALLEYLLH